MDTKDISLLYDALKKGMIDLDQLECALQEMKEKEYLEQHTGKIWQGTNEYWYTRLGGKLIKKRYQKDLEKVVINYYRDRDPNISPTFKQEFEDWIETKKKYGEVKDNSILRYKDDYQRYFKGHPFENLKVEIIDDAVLDDFVRDTIHDYNLTAKAYGCYRTIVIGVLKHAKRKKHTTFSVSNFFKDFEISK